MFFWSFTKEDIQEDVSLKKLVAEKSVIKDKVNLKTSLAHLAEPTAKKQSSIAEQLKESLTNNVKKEKVKPAQLKENLVSNEIKNKEKPKPKPKPAQPNLQRVEKKKKTVITTALVEKPLLEMVSENANSEVHQENTPPFLSELDYDFRRRVPEININVFVYSEIKEDRFIMIDMKKYLPGQQFSSGIKLKEIRLNSIVVEYKNRVFQIQRY
jgi:general secretion pathway protein B